MGIKDLNQLINSFEYIEKSKFRGHRVGMDFLNFWYISHSKACKEEINSLPVVLLQQGKYSKENILNLTLKYFIEYLFGLLRFEVIPLVIFEGKAFDLKNKYAAVRRTKDRERSKERFSSYEGKEITGEKDIQVYKSLFAQTIPFDKREATEKTKALLDRVGLPYLHCITEAEHLGTALCREGFTTAFYTTDTDVLPLGCPFVISREGTPEDFQAPFFKTVQMRKVMKEKGLTFDQFQDLCILASCDYNERIKLKTVKGTEKSVGIKTALNLVKQHGSFRAIQEREEIVGEEKLEYDACKNIFQVFSVQDLCPSFQLKNLGVREASGSYEVEEERYLAMLIKPILEVKVEIYDYPNDYVPSL